MKGVNDVKKESIFNMAENESGTRGNRYKVRKKHTRLKLRQNAFSVRVVNMWNSLPDTTVSTKTINMFKNDIDKVMARIQNKFTYGIGSLWQQTSVN